MTEDKLDRIFTLQKTLDDRILRNQYIPGLDYHISGLCTAIIHGN